MAKKSKGMALAEYAALRIACAAVNVVPYPVACAAAKGLAWTLVNVFRFQRRRTVARIRGCFPERTEREARRIAVASLANMLMNAVEMIRAPRLDRAWIERHVKDAHLYADRLKAIADEGKGVVIMVPHSGNWYMAAWAMARCGVPLFAIAARQRNPYIDAWLNRQYGEGLEVVERGSVRVMAEIKSRLEKGRCFAILPDLRVPSKDVEVPFLNGTANVSHGGAAFATAVGAPVVVAIMRREKGLHVFEHLATLRPDPSKSRREEAVRLTREAMALLDAAVQKTPEHWFWYNKRWILQPVRGLLCALMVGASLFCCRAATAEGPVRVGNGGTETVYDLQEYSSAKAYVAAYADNVQHDADFKAHETAALRTVRSREPFYGTAWSVLPPLLAILLTLFTKEVYSSLFVGIVVGGFLSARFSLEGTLVSVVSEGFIKSIADPYNVGILLFLVLLGALVAMMNRTGASAAFGRWAQVHIRSRTGAQVATALLGLLIFIDDYFNCLTVGGVMRPVTDAKRVSRAKLAYLIDSTAAPICIIAPISSWAAAVAGFAKGAGAESGLALFISAIPCNYYALLTIVTMLAVSAFQIDFGAMRRHERAVAAGSPDPGALAGAASGPAANARGRVYDLFVPMVALAGACVLGMVHSGGYFDGARAVGFVQAFAAADASIGLACGSLLATLFAVVFYLCRRVISFRACMEAFPEGFRMMVPAIMILCCAWTLKGMTDALGARVFISDLVNGSAAALLNFLPAIIFLIAAVLAFSTGTSWGTFGVLIPIVLAAVPGSSLTTLAVSACMAGAVCGDHCSPISDTTIMASAGAQCNHVMHVGTQLPYVILVAGVSFVSYLAAPFLGSVWLSLAVALTLMALALLVLRRIAGAA